MPQALNTGTCIDCNNEQGDLSYSAGPHKNLCQPQPTQEKLRRGFGKNAGEWTGRVEIREEEIPGSRHSMHDHIPTYSQALTGELLSSGFSKTDWVLISASAVLHCGTHHEALSQDRQTLTSPLDRKERRREEGCRNCVGPNSGGRLQVFALEKDNNYYNKEDFQSAPSCSGSKRLAIILT